MPSSDTVPGSASCKSATALHTRRLVEQSCHLLPAPLDTFSDTAYGSRHQAVLIALRRFARDLTRLKMEFFRPSSDHIPGSTSYKSATALHSCRFVGQSRRLLSAPLDVSKAQLKSTIALIYPHPRTDCCGSFKATHCFVKYAGI